MIYLDFFGYDRVFLDILIDDLVYGLLLVIVGTRARLALISLGIDAYPLDAPTSDAKARMTRVPGKLLIVDCIRLIRLLLSYGKRLRLV